jgi:hypothetical protein
MPNTLAHIGVQALATRAVIRDADLKWAFLGAVIPDAPWILRRVAAALVPGLSAYDMWLYAAVQSSLLFCLVLSGALAALSARPGRAFAILALGSLMHLLLDALQEKWANGVHLFAPVSWELLNFGLFWPDEMPTVLLTVLGLGCFAYAWRRAAPWARDPVVPGAGRLALAGVLILVYALLPLALRSGPEAADNHAVRTLREVAARPGRTLELDRAFYERRGGAGVVITYAGEELAVQGPQQDRSGTVSIRGRFVDERTILVTEMHAHWPLARDLANYVGLALIAIYWVRCLRPRLAAAARLRRRRTAGR